jgi:hypothetical protein
MPTQRNFHRLWMFGWSRRAGFVGAAVEHRSGTFV